MLLEIAELPVETMRRIQETKQFLFRDKPVLFVDICIARKRDLKLFNES